MGTALVITVAWTLVAVAPSAQDGSQSRAKASRAADELVAAETSPRLSSNGEAATSASGFGWGPVRALPSQPEAILVLEDEGRVLVATQNGVYSAGLVSGDWALTPGSPDYAYDLVGAPGGRLFAASIGDGVSVSIDGGASWTPTSLKDLSPSTGSRYVYSVAVGPDGAIYATGFEGDIYMSADGGSTWAALPSPPGRVGFGENVRAALPTPSRLLAAPQDLGIESSTDGGVTWEGVTPNDLAVYDFVVGQDRTFSIGSGSNGGLYASDDGGASWARAYAGGGHYLAYSDGVVVIGNKFGGVQATNEQTSLLRSSTRGSRARGLGG